MAKRIILLKEFKGITRHRRPLKLIYSEKFPTRSQAMKFENFLKSGAGHKYLKNKLVDAALELRGLSTVKRASGDTE